MSIVILNENKCQNSNILPRCMASVSQENGSMSSYQHLLHAGNHGDVLKHVVFVSCLEELTKSHEEGVVLLDTHAGIGCYSLTRQTTSEYQEGVERVVDACTDDSPVAVQEYVRMVRSFNDENDGSLQVYPGSPALAAALFRLVPNQHVLWELHPTEFQALQSFLNTYSPCSIASCQDGFAQVYTMLSDKRHNVVLIDPPYKHENEYKKTLQAVKDILDVDSNATVMIWIPHLACKEAEALDSSLLVATKHPWVRASLTVCSKGLLGSTVFIMNPPAGLHDTLQATLPWLEDTLAQDCNDYSVTQSTN